MTWLLLTNIAATIGAWITVSRTHNHIIEHLDRKARSLKGLVLMSAQDTVNTVVAQLRKARTEVLEARDSLTAKIVDLQGQLDNAGVADQVDLSELQAVAQDLDDIVPDVPEVPDVVPAEVVGEPAVEE